MSDIFVTSVMVIAARFFSTVDNRLGQSSQMHWPVCCAALCQLYVAKSCEIHFSAISATVLTCLKWSQKLLGHWLMASATTCSSHTSSASSLTFIIQPTGPGPVVCTVICSHIC